MQSFLGVVTGDHETVAMLNNMIMHVEPCCGNEDHSTFPFIISTGKHKLMIKCFQGGGGNSARFRMLYPNTKQGLTTSDLSGMNITVSLKPKMTGIPVPTPGNIIRVLPSPFMSYNKNNTITLNIKGGPFTVLEIVPEEVNIVDSNGDVVIGNTITWDNATGAITYTVKPKKMSSAIFSGMGIESEKKDLQIKGNSESAIGLEINGWLHANIADSGRGDDATATYDEGLQDITVTASGHDIWETQDDLHFVAKSFSVDNIITIKTGLDSFDFGDDAPEEWSKAGIMFRKNSSKGSPHVFALIRRGQG